MTVRINRPVQGLREVLAAQGLVEPLNFGQAVIPTLDIRDYLSAGGFSLETVTENATADGNRAVLTVPEGEIWILRAQQGSTDTLDADQSCFFIPARTVGGGGLQTISAVEVVASDQQTRVFYFPQDHFMFKGDTIHTIVAAGVFGAAGDITVTTKALLCKLSGVR